MTELLLPFAVIVLFGGFTWLTMRHYRNERRLELLRTLERNRIKAEIAEIRRKRPNHIVDLEQHVGTSWNSRYDSDHD